MVLDFLKAEISVHHNLLTRCAFHVDGASCGCVTISWCIKILASSFLYFHFWLNVWSMVNTSGHWKTVTTGSKMKERSERYIFFMIIIHAKTGFYCWSSLWTIVFLYETASYEYLNHGLISWLVSLWIDWLFGFQKTHFTMLVLLANLKMIKKENAANLHIWEVVY